MKTSIRHLALFVPELQKAEQDYQSIFEMELVGREMPAEQIASVRERLPQDTFIMDAGPDLLTFLDPYQITWQISQPGGEFRTAGDSAGRWLEI
jgi:catechol 2,3-dioxygenase-like lactoylglutathione lyase family enzyme